MGPTTEDVVWKRLEWGRIASVRPAATHGCSNDNNSGGRERAELRRGQRENGQGYAMAKMGLSVTDMRPEAEKSEQIK
jgi:hypothetical protein